MSLFRPNIGSRGRFIRGLGAFALAVASLIVWPQSRGFGIALGLCSAFMAFEAARGWCVARACGVKTKF